MSWATTAPWPLTIMKKAFPCAITLSAKFCYENSPTAASGGGAGGVGLLALDDPVSQPGKTDSQTCRGSRATGFDWPRRRPGYAGLAHPKPGQLLRPASRADV